MNLPGSKYFDGLEKRQRKKRKGRGKGGDGDVKDEGEKENMGAKDRLCILRGRKRDREVKIRKQRKLEIEKYSWYIKI